jgi:acetoin utilization deacetylase AcuC-like enzyme
MTPVNKTGIVKDPIYLEHKPGYLHFESPQRLEVLYEMLEDPDIASLFETITPRKATRQEVELIHRPDYYDYVASTAGKAHYSLDSDTQTSELSFEAALFAVGGLLLGIDKIMKGELTNVFALVRPPGHHAEADRGMGFCLFNNVAIAAAYAMKEHSIKRVLIADWDLHHGNGTQHSFYRDKRVLYFSTHQYPFYPGTGSFGEVGEGEGKGFTVNVPLSMGHGDAEFYKIYKKVLEPIALEFNPELVLVSAGFDTYFKDPLGGMEVTSGGYAALARVLLDIAEKCAKDRLLITLEGGYNLGGLRDGAQSVIRELSGQQAADPDLIGRDIDELGKTADYTINRAIGIQKEYWKCFS